MNRVKSIPFFGLIVLILSCSKTKDKLGPDTSQSPTISIADVSSFEGDSVSTAFEFEVTLSKPDTQTISVHYKTVNGTAKSGEDYVAAGDSLVTFLPNETKKKIAVSVIGDYFNEEDETFCITLFNPVNCTIAKDTGTGTIRNDDDLVEVAYKLHGICFSPYMDGQSPYLNTQISEQQIVYLLSIIAPYTQWVRTFSCTNGLEKIGVNAHKFGLKVAAGAWLSSNLADNEIQIANLIAMGKAGEIDVAVVGNETLLDRELSSAQLINYINEVKAALPGIPVTTGDVYQSYLDHPELINAVDLLYVHIYSYWEGTSISCATYSLDNIYNSIKAQSQGKEILVAESGWPSAGDNVGRAVPSGVNATSYFLDFVSWAIAKEVKYYYFEAYDETWKEVDEGPQGAHWGIWKKNGGDLKPGMNRVFNGEINPDNWLLDTATILADSPQILFTVVPPKGSDENLEGIVKGVLPPDYRIAVFIYVNGWYNKPTWDEPLTTMQCDGYFVCDITTGENDASATKIAAYVVPVGYLPPKLEGSLSIPFEVEQNAIAWFEVIR